MYKVSETKTDASERTLAENASSAQFHEISPTVDKSTVKGILRALQQILRAGMPLSTSTSG